MTNARRFRQIWMSRLGGAALKIPSFLCRKVALIAVRPLYRVSLSHLGRTARFIGPAYFSHPWNISIENLVIIGRNVRMSSEFADSTLAIERGAQINDGVFLDFSGGLTIGADALVSEGALIYTHDHGLDPRSPPAKRPKQIEAGAWIGAHSVVLHSCSKIGRGAVVAAGAIVTKDVEDFTIVAGNPAKPLKRIK